jgi:hypothetical protein
VYFKRSHALAFDLSSNPTAKHQIVANIAIGRKTSVPTPTRTDSDKNSWRSMKLATVQSGKWHKRFSLEAKRSKLSIQSL